MRAIWYSCSQCGNTGATVFGPCSCIFGQALRASWGCCGGYCGCNRVIYRTYTSNRSDGPILPKQRRDYQAEEAERTRKFMERHYE
jgi:hypothetical protein